MKKKVKPVKRKKKSPRPPLRRGRKKVRANNHSPQLKKSGVVPPHSRPRRQEDDVNLDVTRLGEGSYDKPSQTWQIQDVLAWEGTCMLSAEPKTGKTWFVLEMAVSTASGVRFLGEYAVHKTGPALIYSPELKQPALEGRIAEICGRRDLDPKSLNIYINDNYGLRLEIERHQARVLETVSQIRPALVIFDPLSRCYGGGLNSEKGLSKMTEFLITLSRRFGCAVILAHHSAKRDKPRHVFGGKGSGVLSAFADSNLSIISKQRNRSELETQQRAGSPVTIYLRLDGEEDGRCVMAEDASAIKIEAKAGLMELILAFVQKNPYVYTIQVREGLAKNKSNITQALKDLKLSGKLQKDDMGRWFACVPEERDFLGVSGENANPVPDVQKHEIPAPSLAETAVLT